MDNTYYLIVTERPGLRVKFTIWKGDQPMELCVLQSPLTGYWAGLNQGHVWEEASLGYWKEGDGEKRGEEWRVS